MVNNCLPYRCVELSFAYLATNIFTIDVYIYIPFLLRLYQYSSQCFKVLTHRQQQYSLYGALNMAFLKWTLCVV